MIKQELLLPYIGGVFILELMSVVLQQPRAVPKSYLVTDFKGALYDRLPRTIAITESETRW